MESTRSSPIVNRTVTATPAAAASATRVPATASAEREQSSTDSARPRETETSVVHRLMRSGRVQTKLRVGATNDVQEREADRIADAIMAPELMRRDEGNASSPVSPAPNASRAGGRSSATTESSAVASEVEADIEVVRAQGGTPLTAPVRAQFEPKLRFGFGGVRVHTDSAAARATAALEARAFTIGNHIFFSAGEYQPGTREGQRLIAHELVHVIQQRAGDDELIQRRTIDTWEIGGIRLYRTISREVIELPENMTAQQVAKLEDEALAAERRTAALPRPKPVPEVRKPSPKPAKIDLPKPGRRAKRKPRVVQPKLAAVEDALLEAVGEGTVAQYLARKAAPVLTKNVRKISQLKAHEQTHEDGAEKQKKTEDAVVIPASDEQSKANAGQVGVAADRPAPVVDASVGKRTLADSLKANAPRSIGALDNFSRDRNAQRTGAEVLEVVQGDKNAVVKTFGDVRLSPAPIPSNHDPVELPPPERAPATPFMHLGRDAIAPLEKQHTDVSNYTREADAKLVEEGVTQEQLDMVDRGDLAEANKEKKGMAKRAATEPAAVLKMAQEERTRVNTELNQEENAGRRDMERQRGGALKHTGKKQSDAKRALEKKREDVAAEINGRYKATQDKVTKRLAALEVESLKRFDEGNAAAAKDFETNVNAELDAYKDDRYSGWFGWARKAKDWLLGLDDLPEVKRIFERNRERFVQRVSKLVDDISADNARVVQECKNELAATRAGIQTFVDGLEPSLQGIGRKTAGEMNDKLDDLDRTIGKKEEELQAKLKDKQTAAIRAIDEKIEKMKEEMSGALAKVGRLLLLAAKKFFSWALESLGVSLSTIEGIINKGVAVLKAIFTGPIRFVKNLIAAAKMGFSNFAANFTKHLKDALFEWLTGELKGIKLPETWNTRGIVSVLFQAIGITWDNVRTRMLLVIPAAVVEKLESSFSLVKTLRHEGPLAAWEQIKEMAGELKDGFVKFVMEWIKGTVIEQAVKYVLSLFIPGAGMVKAIFAIYDTIVFFIQRAREIMQMIGSFLASIADIAAGKIQSAADALENGLARGLKLVIVFLAKLLKLDGITAKVRQTLGKVRDKVDGVLDRVVAWVLKQAKAFIGVVKTTARKLLDWWRGKKPFRTADGENHEVGFKGEEASAELYVFSTPRTMALFFSAWEKGIANEPNATKRAAQTAALGKARQSYDNIKLQQQELSGPVKKGAVDEEREQQAALLLKQLAVLATLLAKHDLGSSSPFPPAVLPPFVMGVRAAKFSAKFLTRAILDKGSEPGSSRPKSWDTVQRYKLSDKSGWVRMHVLTARLGGKGADSNLVPASGPTTNGDFARAVELPAYNALKGSGAEAETMIWYTMSVEFNEAPDVVDEYGNGFPSRIAISWGNYEPKDGKWVQNNTPKKKHAESPPLPDFTKADSRLKINFERRSRYVAKLKITDRNAIDLLAIRGKKNFVDKTDLLKRVAAADANLAARLATRKLDTDNIDYLPKVVA